MIRILLALGALAAPLAPQATAPAAPDGRRGLGAESPLADIVRPFRQPTAEDDEFLTGLRELDGRLSVLRKTAEGLYRARGAEELIAILGPDVPRELASLHAAMDVADEDPLAVLGRRDRAAEAYARLFHDARFRARRELLLGWERDVRELRAGLFVLQATTDGWVRLTEREARHVAQRVDLAAALLRARILDLEALREHPDDVTEVRAQDVAELLGLVDVADEAERTLRLSAQRARSVSDVARIRTLLFSARLAVDADHLIRWRDTKDRSAEVLRGDVRILRPDTEEGRAAPPDVQRMSNAKRRRLAYGKAMDGLAASPLDAELAFAAARLSRFAAGALDSVNHYDRYLAIRSIRTHDATALRDRELTAEEDEALFQVQEFERSEGLLPDPREEGSG